MNQAVLLIARNELRHHGKGSAQFSARSNGLDPLFLFEGPLVVRI